MSSLDVVIEGGCVVTMDPECRVLTGDIVIRDGKIVDLGPSGQVTKRPGSRTVDARGGFVIPGFVQPHVHLCQALFRGFAEDVPLLEWLSRFIWPFEGAHTPESLRISARLGISELLLGGTTTVLDMGTVHHTDSIFEEAALRGIRLISGKAMMDFGDARPSGLVETTTQSLEASTALARRWHGAAEGRLGYAFAPRFILSCTDELWRETAQVARQMGCLIHTHASENPGEVQAVREVTGLDNIEALHELGITGPDVVLAHCVWLSEHEQELIQQTQTRVAHCPSTNLKLGSGVANVPELLDAGIAVGIAADGAPCNNRLSAFSEMRLAGLLQKPRLGTDALSARQILRMATVGGAEVLGIADRVGSLEVGKDADLVVIRGDRPHLLPRADPYTTLVYAAEAADVQHVFVQGAWRVRDGRVVGVEMAELAEDADRALRGVLARSDLGHLTPRASLGPLRMGTPPSGSGGG